MNSARPCAKRLRGLALLLAVTLCLSGFPGCAKEVSEAPTAPAAPTTVSPAESRETPRPQTEPQTEPRLQTEPETEPLQQPQTEPQTEPRPEETQKEEPLMKLAIDGTELAVLWEDSESVAALRSLAAEAPLTIELSPYGGFEQVGPIGRSLPRNDARTVTAPGDIVLYSGNQIVVFYGSNTWAYTRLGRIADRDAAGMAALLGNGSVTLTIRLD